MIYLYSGTPGSGKSMHLSVIMYHRLKAHKDILCNFPFNVDVIKGHNLGKFTCVDNSELTPKYLLDYSVSMAEILGRHPKEGEFLLVIDEAELLFNSRDWNRKDRNEWLSFFSQHRHYGYDIILVAQHDRMLDRQVRVLIEYEYMHRRANNFGFGGKIIGLLNFRRPVFAYVTYWYPVKQKIGIQFFRFRKKYYNLYDTFAVFSAPN